MLAERLDTGVALYQAGASGKLLMSGDHGQENYNEVQVMKNYAADKGVSTSDVFMDHAGFSTYDSVYRAKEVFKGDKVIIVSQEYHLPRALYLARRMRLDAYGVASDTRRFRTKEFFLKSISPSFLSLDNSPDKALRSTER